MEMSCLQSELRHKEGRDYKESKDGIREFDEGRQYTRIHVRRPRRGLAVVDQYERAKCGGCVCSLDATLSRCRFSEPLVDDRCCYCMS